ncbi:ParM/StbA family protein [Clostridium butyricum]|uniref:ParM/StbA family protein n=1 Tax=Clostridium butyricum TaxID=1492 RepID=UPI0022E1FE35|nr:ParM/StbA family protein [Clostridium butyricum]MDU3597550.1 ParM/StbA family protein [Clostridium butyricum]
MSEKKEKKSEEIILKVGNDNGNNEHDIIINGNLIQQPNVYAKVRKLPNFDEVNKSYVLENISKNLIITCEEPNGIYYIGDYAIKSGQTVRSIEVGVDNNKIESPIVKVNTLAQIAGYAIIEYAQENEIANADIIKVKVDMTTSLPVSYYSKANATKFAEEFLNKKHLVTVHIGNKDVSVQIEFDFVKTIPEGVTASFYFKEASEDLFNEYNQKKEDKLDSEFFNKARVLHVAIGEGTTEYPLTTGIEFNPNFIDGSNNGVGHAIDKALDEFKEEVGLIKFTRQEYSAILKDKNHKYHDLALDIVEQYIEEQAEEILVKTKKVIEKANNEIDVVAVYGGGSILMRESLEKKLQTFCNRAKIKLFYVPEEYTVTLEAKGLYNFTCSKIFSSLKAKYKK